MIEMCSSQHNNVPKRYLFLVLLPFHNENFQISKNIMHEKRYQKEETFWFFEINLYPLTTVKNHISRTDKMIMNY